MNYNEIEIPVPWGTIAAKTWGDCTDPLVLCTHGLVDNSSSFDPIIPFLPKCFYYVCVDLPGHGRSSPFNSLVLRDVDYIIAFRLIYKFFKRDKITIIAHSFSGFITTVFAQFYSRCVEKIIIFDVVYFYPKTPNEMFRRLRMSYNDRTRFLEKEDKTAPSFTKEEIIKKMMINRMTHPLPRYGAEVLVDRSIEPAGDGKCRMTTAQEARQLVYSYSSVDDSVDIHQNFPVKCPHLLILSSDSSFMLHVFRKLLNEYKKNPNFELHVVEGTHDMHIVNAKPVAAFVSKFLLKHQNKL